MTRKRRMFEIDLPEEIPTGVVPAHALPRRRGPMAEAIGETGAALRDRAQIEAKARAENDALAAELVRLQSVGLVLDLIPVDAVRVEKLVRDRAAGRDLELGELKASLREVGLSNPIRVQRAGGGGFELVEGLRRLTAFRELRAETGDARWSAIPAGVLPEGETDASLYRRMVDENLVRQDVSFAEMAALAVSYARSGVDGCRTLDDAVNALYASTAKQKRTYIRRFAVLAQRLGPTADLAVVPRDLGLDVLAAVETDDAARDALVARLGTIPLEDGEGRVEAMRRFLAERDADEEPVRAEAVTPKRAPKPRMAKPTSLTLRDGAVRLHARDGRIELRAARNFAGLGEDRLVRAAEAFLAALEGEFPAGNHDSKR